MKRFGSKFLATLTVLALSFSFGGTTLAAQVLENGINYTVFTSAPEIPEGAVATLIDATVPLATADGTGWKPLGNSHGFSSDGRYLVVEVGNLPETIPSVNIGFFRTDITVPADNIQWVKMTANTAVVFDMGEKTQGIRGFVKVNTDEAKSTAAGFKVYQTNAVNTGTPPAPVTTPPLVSAAVTLGNGIPCQTMSSWPDQKDVVMTAANVSVPLLATDGTGWKVLKTPESTRRYLVVEVAGLPITTMSSIRIGFFRTDIAQSKDVVQWVKTGENTAVVFDLGETRAVGTVKVSTDGPKAAVARINAYFSDVNPAGTFTAVPKLPADTASSSSDWAKADVATSLDLGFVPEELQGNYQQDMTRGEFAKLSLSFAAMQFGCDLEDFPELYHDSHYGKQITLKYADISYTDMNTPNPYVWWATVFGIVNGNSDGSFAPNAPITRQEAAAMLLRTYKLYGGEAKVKSEQTIAVGDVDNWARTDASIVASWGIMTGDGNGFNAHANYTREQCIVTLLRLYQNMDVSRVKGNVTPM